MPGILLDSHALYWLVSGEIEMLDEALVAIDENQEAGTLFVSPVTAWELSIATRKGRVAGRPNLGEVGQVPRRTLERVLAGIDGVLGR